MTRDTARTLVVCTTDGSLRAPVQLEDLDNLVGRRIVRWPRTPEGWAELWSWPQRHNPYDGLFRGPSPAVPPLARPTRAVVFDRA